MTRTAEMFRTGWRRALGVAAGAVLVAGLVLASPPCVYAQGSQQGRPPALMAPFGRPALDQPRRDWLEFLGGWVAAARGHRVGVQDARVEWAASLSSADLAGLRVDLAALRERLLRAEKRRAAGDLSRLEFSYGKRTVSIADVERALQITGDWRDGFNALLKLGAGLHSDVVTLAPAALSSADAGEGTVLILDGRQVGSDNSGVHWQLARGLLDLLIPSPLEHADVHQWYVAVGNWLRREYSYAHQRTHLERARVLYPSDAQILFLSGCVHEGLAAARIQGFLKLAPPGAFSIRSADRELADAEHFLRRAVELAPGHAEAAIRLGRVLVLRQHAGEAADVLARALALQPSNTLAYFGQLFLGDAEQALDHRAAAQSAYERAAELQPAAQSPHLALALLARRQADRPAAIEAIERMFSQTRLRFDPWWEYFGGTEDHADALLDAVRNALSPEGRQ